MAVEGTDGHGQADHARPHVRHVPPPLDLYGIRRPKGVE